MSKNSIWIKINFLNDSNLPNVVDCFLENPTGRHKLAGHHRRKEMSGCDFRFCIFKFSITLSSASSCVLKLGFRTTQNRFKTANVTPTKNNSSIMLAFQVSCIVYFSFFNILRYNGKQSMTTLNFICDSLRISSSQ